MVLFQLVQETPLHIVAERFRVTRGELQTLQTSAASFAGMVSVFCEKLRWRPLALLVAHFQARVDHGVNSDILPLMRIPHVKSFRARMLHNAGLVSPTEVAAAGAERVEEVLEKWTPFTSYHVEPAYQQHRQQSNREIAYEIVRGARMLVS